MYFSESSRENALNPTKHCAGIMLALCIIGIILLLTGCAVRSALKSRREVDVSNIKPGSSRVEVERILGPSRREWRTSSDICYRVYILDLGVRGDEVAGVVLLDAISLGFFELYNTMESFPLQRNSKKVAVSYDSGDMVVGVFDCYEDFDKLPTDGRSGK
jgi:hypothetical protein